MTCRKVLVNLFSAVAFSMAAHTTVSVVYGAPVATAIASFNGVNGSTPFGGLIADTAGNLYGTTYSGGANDQGTVFRVDYGTNAITTLATFNGANGARPYDGLIIDTAGNLYGTTQSGGANAFGTVFRVDAGTNTLTTLASFDGANGREPLASLIADTAGNLYGTTQLGGASDQGTVFRLGAGVNTITTLVNFNGANGREAVAGLIADAAGNLFGATNSGGANNVGTVFRIDAGTSTLTTLATFNGANGSYPRADLYSDVFGNLYGTTQLGGPNNFGTVYRIDAGTNALTTLATFDGLNGREPQAGLIADAAGNLYGSTSLGPNNRGSIFKIEAGTNFITTIHTFDGTLGQNPVRSLIADGEGNLYGMLPSGGSGGSGAIFRIANSGFVPFVPEPTSAISALSAIALILTWRSRVGK
jgi:uncharacterized repeat protein (TIGR03803 family)